MTFPEHLRHDPERCATLRRDLECAWASLDRQGAVVVRVDPEPLSVPELLGLVWHEERRVRALAEREAPDPPPFNWRAHRACNAAWEASQRWEAA